MTNEEAIHIMNAIIYMLERQYNKEIVEEAVSKAIKALEQLQDIHDTCKKCIEFSEFKQQPSEPRTNLAETSQDCISRTELIQKLNAWDSKAHGIPNYAWKVIREMPSVTPTNEDIKEAYLKGYDYGVKDWFKSKTQPCEDAVSREEVQDLISIWLSDYLLDETREALETINYKVGDMPAVYPERPKPDMIERIKKAIDEMTEIHSDGEFYIKNVDAKWIIGKYLYGAELSGGGEDENNPGC